MDNETGAPASHISKKVVIVSILFFLLIIIGVYFLFSPIKNGTFPKNPAISTSLNVKTTPEIIFGKYTNKSPFPVIPVTFNSYVLKTNFTTDEILSFAKKLGLENFKMIDDKNILVTNLNDKNKRGILTFNKQSGAFSFESYGILKPVEYVPNQNIFEESRAFLKELGIYDNTITCNNTYERSDTSNKITYVECHRDWRKTGIPIVNLGGILTLSENKKISDLQTGGIDDSNPLDSFILNVKDSNGVLLTRENGRSRPDDFNTITIGVSKDGRILSVVSNVKWIDIVKIVDSRRDLITPQEALTLFQNHKSQFSITIPAGMGTVDWDKVYPGNQALSDSAEINDISLVFLDKPVDTAQADYSPSYLIRGTAVLKNGYSVKYVQTIPALKSDFALFYKTKSVAGVKTVSAEVTNPNLQMDSFTPGAPSSVPYPSALPIIPPSSGEGVECDLSNGIGEINLDVPGYGKLSIVMKNAHTFFLKKTKATNAEIINARRALYKAVQEQYKINVAKWIKQNSVQSDLTTLDKVKDFFEGTIDQIYDNTCQQISLDNSNIREAPYVCYYEDRQRKKTPNILTLEVTNEVAAWALGALKNTSELDTYAGKADLFPEITLQDFHYVFILPRAVDEQYFKCILTAYSPAIFLYPSQELEVSVQTGAPVTYADPVISGNVWNITAFSDGTIKQDGITRENLYYEYAKNNVKLTEPSGGFVVKTSEWKDFIKNNLARKLGLNSKETESLITEVNNALFDSAKTQYLKMSLISKAELNQKLPLSIDPTPDNIYRINLYIKPVDAMTNLKNWTNLPNLTKREGFTVVELGAYLR